MTLWREFLAAALALLLAAAHAAEPNIEFSGVLTADGRTRLALTDKATKTTQWVDAGGEFDGYEVTRYDPKEDAVFLRKDGQEYRLALVSPKTAIDARNPAAIAANPPSTEAAANAIRGNLRTLMAAARQYQADRNVSSVSYGDIVGPGRSIAELKPVAGENYSSFTFSPNMSSISVTMADGAIVTLDLPPPAAGLAAQSPARPTPPTGTSANSAPGLAASVPAGTAGASPANGTAGATPPISTTPPPPTPIAADVLAPTGRDLPSPSYTIQGGDTWEKISGATGIPVEQLQRLNPVLKGNSLPAGQTIRIQ